MGKLQFQKDNTLGGGGGIEGLKFILNDGLMSAIQLIVKRDIIINNNIFFPEHTYWEDILFQLKCIYFSKIISKLEYPGYNYVLNSNSITANFSYKHLNDIFTQINDIKYFLIDKKIYKELHSLFIHFCYRIYFYRVKNINKVYDKNIRHKLYIELTKHLTDLDLLSDSVISSQKEYNSTYVNFIINNLIKNGVI